MNCCLRIESSDLSNFWGSLLIWLSLLLFLFLHKNFHSSSNVLTLLIFHNIGFLQKMRKMLFFPKMFCLMVFLYSDHIYFSRNENSDVQLQIGFLISSPEHKVLMVSYCDQSMSVVRRASSVVRHQQFVLKANSSWTLGPMWFKLHRNVA